jgi:hypothetical protein
MMCDEIEIKKKLKRLLKSELKLRGLTYEDLSLILQKHGVVITKSSIDNRLSRGSFGAVFFLQCLFVIGCCEIDLRKVFNDVDFQKDTDD